MPPKAKPVFNNVVPNFLAGYQDLLRKKVFRDEDDEDSKLMKSATDQAFASELAKKHTPVDVPTFDSDDDKARGDAPVVVELPKTKEELKKEKKRAKKEKKRKNRAAAEVAATLWQGGQAQADGEEDDAGDDKGPKVVFRSKPHVKKKLKTADVKALEPASATAAATAADAAAGGASSAGGASGMGGTGGKEKKKKKAKAKAKAKASLLSFDDDM